MSARLDARSGDPKPLLEVRDLKKYFPIHKGFFGRHVGDVKAVDGISFDIFPKETLGVVGESGCGKTTAGRTILRLLDPTAGTAKFEGKDIFSLSKSDLRAMRRDMQIIFQDPFSSLNPRMTVGSIIGDALDLHGIVTGDARFDRAKELLERVGLQSSYVNRYPHEFSGGQRQRIGIARAIALNPKFIVCDEAVSALDVSVQAQVLNLLQELQDEYKLSYMFIAHDLAVVRHIADRVAVMYLGEVVELSPCDDLFEQPLHPYTQALLSAIPLAKPGRRRDRILLQGDVPNPINPPKGCHFHTRCPLVMDRCRHEAPRVLEVRDAHQVSCHLYEGATVPAATIPIDGEESASRRAQEAAERRALAAAAEGFPGTDASMEVFDGGSEDGDLARPISMPEVLKVAGGYSLGPFGEVIDPYERYASTGEIPSIEAILTEGSGLVPAVTDATVEPSAVQRPPTADRATGVQATGAMPPIHPEDSTGGGPDLLGFDPQVDPDESMAETMDLAPLTESDRLGPDSGDKE